VNLSLNKPITARTAAAVNILGKLKKLQKLDVGSMNKKY
jgi:hypothetical protein